MAMGEQMMEVYAQSVRNARAGAVDVSERPPTHEEAVKSLRQNPYRGFVVAPPDSESKDAEEQS